MAKQGTFLMGEDSKYLVYYMGTDTDPNHAASYLTLSFFAMGAFAWMTEQKWLKTIFYITMAASVTALFITGSRGGMLGLFAMAALFFAKFAKVGLLALGGLGAAVSAFFKRRKG